MSIRRRLCWGPDRSLTPLAVPVAVRLECCDWGKEGVSGGPISLRIWWFLGQAGGPDARAGAMMLCEAVIGAAAEEVPVEEGGRVEAGTT